MWQSGKIELSEDEVIEIIKSTLRKYPKELEYLKKNEEILKGNHWKNAKEKEKIIKILGVE